MVYIDLPVRHHRTRREVNVAWPILQLSSWAEYELSMGGELLLAGNNIRNQHAWRSVLTDFWQKYKAVDATHPVYQSMDSDYSNVIPYMIHGDEGRGRGKLPLLSIAFQGLMSHYGVHRLNSSGYFGCVILGCLSYS